jgi:hypothetical protein
MIWVVGFTFNAEGGRRIVWFSGCVVDQSRRSLDSFRKTAFLLRWVSLRMIGPRCSQRALQISLGAGLRLQNQQEEPALCKRTRTFTQSTNRPGHQCDREETLRSVRQRAPLSAPCNFPSRIFFWIFYSNSSVLHVWVPF